MNNLEVSFKFHKKVVTVRFSREDLLKLHNSKTCFTAIKFKKPIQHGGISYPWGVVRMHVTPTFEVQQAGEGFPCQNATEANALVTELILKYQNVPLVGLLAGPGHFDIGTFAFETSKRRLSLDKIDPPKEINGQQCGFSVQLFRDFLDKPSEVIWADFLPTTDPKVALKLFRKREAGIHALDKADTLKSKNCGETTKAKPDLTAVQLKVLSKAFPETVKFFTNPDPAKVEHVFVTYRRELFALTGELIGTQNLTLDKSEFEKIASACANIKRRKNSGLNDVEVQLVAGWYLVGYDRMTPKQRHDHLQSIGLHPHSPEAVRKMCDRLQLPSARRPGRP